MRREHWLLFAVGWLSAAHFTPREPGWNVNTRLALTWAIVDEHRLAIDSFHETPGYETGDKAFFEGHFYSDKAIGNALAAVVPYQVARWLGVPMTPTAKRMICTIFTVGLAFGALLVVMARLFERLGLAPGHAAGLALLGGLGTMLYPYATILMPYAPACLFTMLSYLLTLPGNGVPPSPHPFPGPSPRPGASSGSPAPGGGLSLWRVALAGWCAGLALLFEMLFGLAVVALGLHVLLAQPTARRAVAAAAVFGCAAFVAFSPFLLYTWAIFGRLTIPYEFEHDPYFREAMAQGFMGIRWPPRWTVLWLVTFHPFRGLFFHSPLLLAALPGLIAATAGPRGWRRVLMWGGLPLLHLLVNAGYWHQWWGGWACGPRLLMPAVPFLLLAVGAAWLRWRLARPVILALGIVSVALQLLAAGIDPQPPTPVPGGDANAHLAQARLDQVYPDPITTCYLPRLRRGNVAWNPAHWAGVPGAWSWLPLVTLWAVAGGWLFRPRKKTVNGADEPSIREL